jgi:hypothetical protein
VPLLTEILGALVAGALIFIVARELGAEHRRAFGAVSLVAISVAAVLAIPNLRDDVSALLHQRKEFVGLSKAEANVKQGDLYGLNTGFLSWAEERIGEDETFALEIGTVPGEETLEGGGILQGTIFSWSTFQFTPRLLVQESVGPDGEVVTQEGPPADWIVFYQKEPSEYAGTLGKVISYEPNFAIARPGHAG